MESENSVDSVTDLACILEIFFKGLSECGVLSTYSVQLQTAISDVTVHLKFCQHVYQIMKSLQVLLQRISRLPGGKSISSDRATQTEPFISSESERQILRCRKSSRPVLRKVFRKGASHVPLNLLKSSDKVFVRTKPKSLSSGNAVDAYSISDASLISLKESVDVPSTASHPSLVEEVTCPSSNVSQISSSPNDSIVSSSIGFGTNSPTHGQVNSANQPSQVSSKLGVSERISVQEIHSENGRLLSTSETSRNCSKNSISTTDLLSATSCTDFSSDSQIHSLDTSSELVPQDLIAVLDDEDVSNQQETAVLFLQADDTGEEISHDEVTIQEERMESRTLPLEEDMPTNIQQDSSLYSYTAIVEKEDSNSSKSIKEGMDIVSSLEDHEDLGLFCKDGVELDPMHSVAVEVVEKGGGLISIFTSNSPKEDDDNSTSLYGNDDVLSPKKDVHMGNVVNSKNGLIERFFDPKLDSRQEKRTSFALIGMKMEDVNSQGGSDDDTEQFTERQCITEDPCNELHPDKEDRCDNGEAIGLEGDIDPDDELGQNFVHIVVTASRVIPDKDMEENLRTMNLKNKRVKNEKKDRNNSECICTTCNATFSSLSSLQNHLKKKHANFNQCDFCQKVFPTIGSLVDHCRDMHDGIGCFECEECGKRLKSRLSLRRHQESHQGRKEAVCHECGKTFCRGDYLIRHHQMVHAGERPYQCSHCSQRFLSKGHLHNHLSVHTGERNHKCGICGKMFSRSDKLREHVLRHLSAKRHSCPSCGRSYADKRDLNKHQSREPGCNLSETATACDATNSPC